MRVLQASKAYWPHVGGVETVVQQLAEGFAGAGCDSAVLVASDTRRGFQGEHNGVEVQRVPSLGRLLSLPIAPTYPAALRRAQADVLLVHEPSLLAAASLFAGGRRASAGFGRLVVWWHSDIIRQQLLGRAYRPILQDLLAKADRIIVATPHHVTSSSMLGPFDSKIDVVPFGINTDRFVSDPMRKARVQQLRRRWRDEPLILFVGRLARYKGLHRLAAAMDEVPTGHLVVVGDGPCRRAITESSAYRAGKVTLLSHVGEQDLGDLFWAADVFALPSDQPSEAFGIVQLEAMACATPVVTLDLPTGVTWVNRDGETGLVARRGDPSSLARAINTLITDRSLRRSLGERAQARVRAQFTEEAMVASTLDVTRNALLHGAVAS